MDKLRADMPGCSLFHLKGVGTHQKPSKAHQVKTSSVFQCQFKQAKQKW